MRLVQVVQNATDDADAARRVAEAFGLEPDLADAALDLQVRRLTPSTRARLTDGGCRRVGHALGPAPRRGAAVRDPTPRHADREQHETHTFRGTSPNDVLTQVIAFLHEHVTQPQMRPVVLEEVGITDAARYVVSPDGSGYRDSP